MNGERMLDFLIDHYPDQREFRNIYIETLNFYYANTFINGINGIDNIINQF